MNFDTLFLTQTILYSFLPNSSLILLFFLLFSCIFTLCVYCYIGHGSKKSRVSQESTLTLQLAPYAHTFLNYKFPSEPNAEKYLKLVIYHLVKEMAFNCEDLGWYNDLVETLQQRQWVWFNNLIQETNKFIGLQFYANVAYLDANSYISYVRGKYVDFSGHDINSLINLQPSEECTIRSMRRTISLIDEHLGQEMLNAFCRPGDEWVIVCSLALKLNTSLLCPIARARASFFV